jgi:TRAP-type C4-dicarboxylate transport system substrate-binding protein
MPEFAMTWDALSPAERRIIEDAAKAAEVKERNVVLYKRTTFFSPTKRKSVEALLSL